MSANSKIRNILFFLALAIIGLTIRILYILPPATLDGDSAIFALMAKHISELKEFPIYMWRAHYGGTLSCYVGAALFRLFGVSSATFSAVGVLFSCLWVLFTFIFARKILDYSGSFYASMLALLPPSYVLLFSLRPVGVYIEALIFGSLSLILLITWINKSYHNQTIFYLAFGLVLGIGLWLTPFFLPFLFTIITVFIIKDKRIFLSNRFLFFVIGLMIGYMPAIIYNFQYPLASFFRIGGRILDLDRSILSSPDLKGIIARKILWRISTIPTSLVRIPILFLSLTGVINTGIFFIAIFWIFKKDFMNFLKNKKMGNMNILIIYVFWFIVFYSTLVGENATRYIVPLYAAFPLLVGKLLSDIRIKSNVISLILLGAMLFYNGYSNVHAFLNKKVYHFPELAKWLESKKFLYGYSDWRIAYPVIFESNEKVLISPTLFHPTFSDRRPEYTMKVRNVQDTVFILHRDRNFQAIIDIEKRLSELNVSYKKDIFKEFNVL